jgi:hypothetical protein
MYTFQNFKTKKELKEAVAVWNASQAIGEHVNPLSIGAVLAHKTPKPKPVRYYQPNDMGFAPLPLDGTIYVEGPHYPQPHKWYATCEVKDGVIVKVR